MDSAPALWQGRDMMNKVFNLTRFAISPFALVSTTGLLLGALCFIGALTPSLVPRAGLVQGALAGFSFAIGYGVGVLLSMIWQVLHLPVASEGARRWLFWGVFLAAVIAIFLTLGKATDWQNALHTAMGLPPVETVRPFTIAWVSIVVASLLIAIGRAFRKAALVIARRLSPIMPERLALVLGILLAVLLFNFIGNDVIIKRAFVAFDASYLRLDQAMPVHDAAPTDPMKTGGPGSMVAWEGIGAQGRSRVADPLNAAGIAEIAGTQAMEPLRVYVGLGSAEEVEDRAQLALQEAIRVGAFDRSTLVIATPTGTGWIDPSSMMPLEVLTRGDVATISVQYSYLPSWLSLIAVPEYGAETARATFAAIHGYWRNLPAETRPRLYLFGLSLGSLNSDLSADFYDLISAPYHGAYWVGPPFGSRSWRQITAGRVDGTPEWLPRFRDGSVVRFLNQTDMPDAGKPWGPMRIVYLQYASDAITFFSPSILWREPDWMKAPRGPDVIKELRWIPVVSFLQVGFDLMTATTAPMGHGHVYAGEDYLQGWLALLSPEGWDPAALDRLRAAMTARGL